MIVEIDEQPGSAEVVVRAGGRLLEIGRRLKNELGLDAVVDERIRKVVVYLALRRFGGVDGGWVSADELAFVVDDARSRTSLAKYLERRLLPYFAYSQGWAQERSLTEEALPRTHLIHYRPRQQTEGRCSGGSCGGLSRGPYRLGATPLELRVNKRAAWACLYGARAAAGEVLAAEDALDRSAQLFDRGELLGARAVLAAALHGLAQRPSAVGGLREQRMALARLLGVIANLDMELGQPRLSIDASERAFALYRSLGHPAGVVHTLQVAAHAHGQLEQVRRAASLAAQAHALCDADRELRRGWRRALLIGARGQRESKLGQHALAERRLEHAERACAEAGIEQWAAIWAVRRAENAIGAGRLIVAERHLERAHQLGRDPRTTVPHRAATVRITAHFLAVTRPAEAITWAGEGQRIGVEKGMANQVRLMRPILALLGMEADGT